MIEIGSVSAARRSYASEYASGFCSTFVFPVFFCSYLSSRLLCKQRRDVQPKAEHKGQSAQHPKTERCIQIGVGQTYT